MATEVKLIEDNSLKKEKEHTQVNSLRIGGERKRHWLITGVGQMKVIFKTQSNKQLSGFKVFYHDSILQIG